MKLHAYLLSLVLILILNSQLFAEGERVDAKCEVGIGNQIREHSWHSLFVTLQNYYPEKVDVQVTITRKVIDQPLLILEQAVTLDAGSREGTIKLEFSCPPVKKTIGLQYIILVRELGTSKTLLKYYDKKYRKVRRDGIDYWQGKWLEKDDIKLRTRVLGQDEEVIICINNNNSSKNVKDYIDASGEEKSKLTIAQRQVDDLPMNHLLLDGIKLIIIKNPEISKMQFGGRDKALVNWVRSGGTLIYILSEKSEEYKSLRLTTEAGLSLKTMTIVERTKEQLPNTSKKLKSWQYFDVPVQCIEAELTDPETTMTKYIGLRKGQSVSALPLPLVNVRWVGSGKIVSVLVDIDISVEKGIPAYLLKEIVMPIFSTSMALESLQPTDDDENGYRNPNTTPLSGAMYEDEYYDTEPPDLQYGVGDTINNIQQAKPIKFGIIAIFIGIYMIVIAFVDFILLKFMSLLHWTWLSVLIWVVAFSIIADKIGETFRGGEMSQREIAVFDSGLGASYAKLNQYAGVFSQQNQSYTVFHDSKLSGVTRLERIVEGDTDWETGYPGRQTNNVGGQNVDERTEFLIAQSADIDQLKHSGSYLKSVILPRWVIRDVQSNAIIEKPKEVGIGIEYSNETGYYDIRKNVYSKDPFDGYIDWRNVEVSKVTVTNNYPYPISGLCIIYGGNKIALYNKTVGMNESIDFYYMEDDKVLINNFDNLIDSDTYRGGILEVASHLNVREIVGSNSARRLNRFIKVDKEKIAVFADTRNSSRIPKEAFIMLLASCRKLLTEESKTNEISAKAFSNLDISHRIASGETIVLSWTDWHFQNKIDATKKPKDSSSELKAFIKYVESEERSARYPWLSYAFSAINFEDWHPQTSRFIVNRYFTKPIEYLCPER